MSAIVHTGSAEDTRVVAARLAALVRAGDLIVLCGDLGAGKTTFTQGFSRALGVTSPVTSPTFTLANRYEGSLIVNHLDVYRLAHIDEVADLGLAELVDDRSVTLIEWGTPSPGCCKVAISRSGYVWATVLTTARSSSGWQAGSGGTGRRPCPGLLMTVRQMRKAPHVDPRHRKRRPPGGMRHRRP